MQPTQGIIVLLVFLKTASGTTETNTNNETVVGWTMEHQFSSVNADYWNKTLLQLAVNKRALHINSIDPSLGELVRCTIPNKTGMNWPFETMYRLISLENGKTLVLQNQTFDVVDVQSCEVEVEFNHTCEIFVPNVNFFDCFPANQTTEASMSYDRYDDKGKFLGRFEIKRVLDFHSHNSNNSKESTIYRIANSCSKVSFYAWEQNATENELLNLENPPSSSTVKLLDSDYGVVSEHKLKHRVYTARSFAHGNLTICDQWFNLSRTLEAPPVNKTEEEYLGFTECRLYDARLKLVSSVMMNLPPETANEMAYMFSRSYLVVHNFLGGGAVILFQVSTNEVFYRVIEADGMVSEDNVIFYKYEKHPFNLEEEYNFCKMYLWEKNAQEREYCGAFGIWNKFSGRCMKF